MRHVHIVLPYESAAMQRLSHPLVELLPKLYRVTAGADVDIKADANIHIPFHTMAGLEDKGKGKHIVAYTHTNKGQEAMVVDACNRADMITAMSFRGRDELLEMGVDPKKIHVIYCAADGFFYRRRLVGVVGYPQPNGRKRESLLLDMAWNYDLTPYEFVFTGVGWEDTVKKLQSLGVSCTTRHADDYNKLQEVMRFLDVLLVTGYREGGPLPLLECMSVGIPVLSPDFGYAADLLDDKYIYNTPDDLMQKLNDLFGEGLQGHMLARMTSWSDYAEEYALLLGDLLGESVDLFPERGMPRYKQIYDIIREIKPSSICEIGTWNGKNARRMIQIAQQYNDGVYYQGFDLFDTMTGRQFVKEHSKRGHPKAIVQKILSATGADVALIEGDTNETITRFGVAGTDMYFVDGGHSESTIENDGLYVLGNIAGGGVAIFDDYYHGDRPEGIGCNKFIDRLDKSEFKVTIFPELTTDFDGNKIGMVKVERNADIHIQRRDTQEGDQPSNVSIASSSVR